MNRICRACKGLGQTKETSTVMKFIDRKLKTIKQGSGCPVCLGIGIKGERK